MQRLNKIIWAVVLAVFALAFVDRAEAASMRAQLSGLEVLPIPYGVTTLTIEGRAVMVIRGNFTAFSGWGGDTYQILAYDDGPLIPSKDKPGVWKIAEYEAGKGAESLLQVRALAVTIPHTFEDSVVTVRLMVPHTEHVGVKASALYLLRASRKYMMDDKGRLDTEAFETKVDFSLFKLHFDKDFSIFEMQEIAAEQAGSKYKNSDCAILHELDVPSASNQEDLTCN